VPESDSYEVRFSQCPDAWVAVEYLPPEPVLLLGDIFGREQSSPVLGGSYASSRFDHPGDYHYRLCDYSLTCADLRSALAGLHEGH